MLRKFSLLLIPFAIALVIPLAFSLEGCSSGDLPTVSPAPPPGTVKEAPSGAQALPKDVYTKLKARAAQRAGKAGSTNAD
jgi:hypothetical protein